MLAECISATFDYADKKLVGGFLCKMIKFFQKIGKKLFKEKR